MINSVDLYLGTFLISCGFALSLLNLRRVVKGVNSAFPAVLISENALLMCVGIAFVNRSVHVMGSINTEPQDIEERISNMHFNSETKECNFLSVLKNYGPLIISLVNSFLSLIIDNYMHYRMLADVKKEDDENAVHEFNQRFQNSESSFMTKFVAFGTKHFSYIAIVLQWILPIIIALSMYMMEVKEKQIINGEFRSNSNFCMAMVDVTNKSCLTNMDANYSLELRKLIPTDYIEANEDLIRNDTVSKEINSVISNIYQIIANIKNESSQNLNVTSSLLWRKPKMYQNCMTVCYLENNILILYMFLMAIVSYFVPITISTVILTKIHLMDLKKPGVKTYVSRELLYNILFWTPVMFDTFLSLLLCSYSMNGMRTSILNIVANVYQAVKNFLNTKYFQDNSVKPI